MACDTRIRIGQQIEQRRREVEESVKRLERALGEGSARMVVGPTGAVTFVGWDNRDDVSDLCAYRRLKSSGSAALRRAEARAEALAGRKVDQRQVNSGVHSHDGGK